MTETKIPVRVLETGAVGSLPYVTVGGIGNFSVRKTFECGQAFRFEQTSAPSVVSEDAVCYRGVAHGRDVTFCEEAGRLTVVGSSESEFFSLWQHYLSLDTDYDDVDRRILLAMPTESSRRVMENAVRCGAGIRILRQEPFEALISFIISQNNNIPRIKKIIAALCDTYGENGAFPTPRALYDAGEAGLFALRTGFRAGYIRDAARQILEGEVDLSAVTAADYPTASAMLQKIRGVGPKVSACALLFGFGKTEAFPIDVWIKKSIERHFPDGFDPLPLSDTAGIAQQYLFFYERYLAENA